MFKRFKTALLALAILPFVAGAALAHPHIFIITGLGFETDAAGRLTAVSVSWEYDELYSLLVTEDMELDDDYDGKLTPEELARLNGFDQNWDAGFAGDLYIEDAAGQKLRLGGPENLGTSFEDGKITTRHRRGIEGAAATGPWRVKAYDPSYYTAYELGRITLPEGCESRLIAVNLTAAQEALQAELAKIPADVVEMDYPPVGEEFADTLEVSCQK
ncbi:DUF1007 family protein [Rhodalgimonas zhirmunskyi]|nr:DUF1007 family protein [Rhodoalgimonas zhirmunskyi]